MSEGLKPCPACGGAAEFMVVEGRIFVSCPECGMRGPSLSVTCRNFKKIESRVDADAACIDAWNALPRRLRWTKETLTEPGWYWHKLRANGPAQIVDFRMYRNRPREFSYLGWRNYADELRGFFAGPIPEPEKPQ